PHSGIPFLAESGPEPIGMHGLHVHLHLFPAATGDHAAALVVDLEHEPMRDVLGVPEIAAEDVGHIGHQVDRVVPPHGLPGPVTLEGFILLDGLRLHRYRCCGHRLTLTTRRRPHARIARGAPPSPTPPHPLLPIARGAPPSPTPPHRRTQRSVHIESLHRYP